MYQVTATDFRLLSPGSPDLANTGISLIELVKAGQLADAQISALNVSQSIMSEVFSSNLSSSISLEKSRAVDAEAFLADMIATLESSLETTNGLLSSVKDQGDFNTDQLSSHSDSLTALQSDQIVFGSTQTFEKNRLDGVITDLKVVRFDAL